MVTPMQVSNKKLLTISIAAYNVEAYLDGALESCLSVIEHLDVIVVNDGSTDDTLSIALHWASRFPDSITVIDKPNGGYGSTINSSLKIARGEYFRYLDGDDWLDDALLPSYIELLENNNADLIVTPYRRVYENGDPAETIDCLPYLPEGPAVVEHILADYPIAGCAMAYKTELLRACGYSMTENCFYTDLEYAYLPFMSIKSIYVSRLAIYKYRIGRMGQSVSVEGICRHYKDTIRVCQRLITDMSFSGYGLSEYILHSVSRECCIAYSHLCTAGPARSVKHELIQFDQRIKKDAPEVYRVMPKISKRVALLRYTCFLTWRLCCWLIRRGA